MNASSSRLRRWAAWASSSMGILLALLTSLPDFSGVAAAELEFAGLSLSTTAAPLRERYPILWNRDSHGRTIWSATAGV